MRDADYTAILLEELREQNKAILEYVSGVPAMADRLQRLEDKTDTLTADVKVMKAAVTDVGNHLADHEHRLTNLEAA